jgi:hypothetical protein
MECGTFERVLANAMAASRDSYATERRSLSTLTCDDSPKYVQAPQATRSSLVAKSALKLLSDLANADAYQDCDFEYGCRYMDVLANGISREIAIEPA